jgi:hypothetical protein
MGLLRKAAVAVTRDAGEDLSPSLSCAEPALPPVRRSGLLRRSLDALTVETAAAVSLESAPALSVELAEQPEPQAPAPLPVEPPAISRAVDAIGDIISALRALPDTLELPSEMFSLLARRLGLVKAALLLYDPLRIVFAPWASCGYDQTTLHRMRIPLGANESWNALANGAPLSLDSPQALAPYQQSFSAREFGSVSRMVLTPFIAGGKLVAVLLITELRSPFSSDEELMGCLAVIGETGAALVQRSRGDRLAVALAESKPPSSPEDEATRYIAGLGASGTRILFVSLSLEAYARRIVAAHEHLDPFRLHEDLRYFLDNFVADLGVAITIRQGAFLLGLQGVDAPDLDLFLHQLASHLDSLFGGNGHVGPTAGPQLLKRRWWPEEGTDVRALVDFFSS